MASTSTLLTLPVASISIPSTTPTGIAVRKLPLERCIPSDADLMVDNVASILIRIAPFTSTTCLSAALLVTRIFFTNLIGILFFINMLSTCGLAP